MSVSSPFGLEECDPATAIAAGDYAPGADGETVGLEMKKLSLYEPQEWPELLSPGDVAALFRLAQTTIARWCEQGTIEAVHVGRVWRIPREAVWPLVPPSIRAGWPEGPWKEHGERG